MTDHDDDLDLSPVDDIARAASRGLHAHVARRIHPDTALALLPSDAKVQPKRRFLAVAAVLALLVGSAVVLSDHQGGDGRSRLDVDEDGNPLPVPKPGVLTALGPTDGKDSIGLPVAVEPSVDLQDGDAVVASGSGFEPGEQVGIVQCAREAGGDARETRGGVDGCDVGGVVYATAGIDGVATGRFTVHRELTTPLTGTVDCAAEAERCLIGMGAINDYDRSGGFGIAFRSGGEPIDVPSLQVEPASDLRDGDRVHVTGDGFAPGELVMLSICAKDPSACWKAGGLTENEGYAARADGDGRIDVDANVYRFLPGPDPATYVDCAISACSLRGQGDPSSPAPVALAFTADDAAPVPPAVAVDPSSDLAFGDTVVVRGAGFSPHSRVSINLCAGPVGPALVQHVCSGASIGDAPDIEVDDDGTFAVEIELPDLGGGSAMAPSTTACAGPNPCSQEDVVDGSCDGVRSSCAIVVEAYTDDPRLVGPPMFGAAPVPVTFRPS